MCAGDGWSARESIILHDGRNKRFIIHSGKHDHVNYHLTHSGRRRIFDDCKRAKDECKKAMKRAEKKLKNFFQTQQAFHFFYRRKNKRKKIPQHCLLIASAPSAAGRLC